MEGEKKRVMIIKIWSKVVRVKVYWKRKMIMKIKDMRRRNR
jgi:hypothetical protein